LPLRVYLRIVESDKGKPVNREIVSASTGRPNPALTGILERIAPARRCYPFNSESNNP